MQFFRKQWISKLLALLPVLIVLMMVAHGLLLYFCPKYFKDEIGLENLKIEKCKSKNDIWDKNERKCNL